MDYRISTVSGKTSGETYEEVKDETDDSTQWDQIFNVYFITHTVIGWPKFMIEVWCADEEGRYSIRGYGVKYGVG